jgi:hypothetical protein
LWLSLSLIPHPGDRTGCHGLVRVGCGWVEHETVGSEGCSWFGTLLGPERTPCWLWVFFLAAPGLDRLTLCLSGWWWLWGWGVVVC